MPCSCYCLRLKVVDNESQIFLNRLLSMQFSEEKYLFLSYFTVVSCCLYSDCYYYCYYCCYYYYYYYYYSVLSFVFHLFNRISIHITSSEFDCMSQNIILDIETQYFLKISWVPSHMIWGSIYFYCMWKSILEFCTSGLKSHLGDLFSTLSRKLKKGLEICNSSFILIWDIFLNECWKFHWFQITQI